MKLGPKAAAAALIISASLALTACGGSAPAAGGAGAAGTTSLTLGTVVDLKSFDTSVAHIGHTMPIFQAAYDTLIQRLPDGKLAPMLATKWEYNADNTVLTVSLRTGVTFSDGAKFDAAAAKANLDYFKKVKGSDAYQVASLGDVAVVDDSTLKITLTTPDPAFEYYLTQAAGLMGSPKVLGTPEMAAAPDGTGPYVMDKASSVVGSQYVFTKREGYWNTDLQKFSKVTFKVLTDLTARTNALVSGQIDGALLDPKTGKQADAAGMKLNASQVDWQGLLLFDRDGKINPELANVKVRQAINYAFDRKTILDQQLLGQGTVTSQVFGPESGAYIKDLDTKYTYDPAKAKSLLAEAGYASGFTLKLPTFTGYESLVAIVTQQLGDIGIKVEAVPEPQANLIADFAAGKFAAAPFQLYQGEPWVAINQMISTTALYNPFKNTSPELQAKIDAVHNGAANSAELAKDVNTYVTDNAWFAPLYRLNQMYYTSKAVTVTPQLQQAVPSLYNYAPAK
ncbi:ABC transporter substrate-binding protein [Arthrobacter sp. PAMC25564]|uniref:ABC transporter substrate-binding protein n=1 Tax=Arthrobacter sp. PAMC25564 TaxID=2565366 RepID=UPI0010A2455D|nr:ABC transporter substrate-binding protein [Arthrobacter sp. PAMC25564]QCB95701.1 ABC transporter substrate-binding protein [Arthrobacter sp. PAMC25564]